MEQRLFHSSCLLRCWVAFSALTLGGRKNMRPIKNLIDEVLAQLSVCRGADNLHMVHLMLLPPHHLCFRKSRTVYPSGTDIPGLSQNKRPLNDYACMHGCVVCVSVLKHKLTLLSCLKNTRCVRDISYVVSSVLRNDVRPVGSFSWLRSLLSVFRLHHIYVAYRCGLLLLTCGVVCRSLCVFICVCDVTMRYPCLLYTSPSPRDS